MKTRVVRGICDSYVVREAIDGRSRNPFLEVYEHVTVDGKNCQGEWLCDIDGTMNLSDESILDEIDAALIR